MRDSPTSEWFIFFVCSSFFCFYWYVMHYKNYATVEYCDHCYQALPPMFSTGTGSFLYPLVNVRCVSLLSSPDTLSCQDGWSSLMSASRNGHVEVVDKLLQHGATADLKDEVITTPICKYEIYNHMCLKLVIFHHHTISL